MVHEPFSQLALLGVSRADVCASLAVLLQDDLIRRLPGLSREVLDGLLAESFQYVVVPELRGLVFTLLQLHPAIPPTYLKDIASNPTIYDACPLSVKRQLWERNEAFFRVALQPKLKSLTSEGAMALLASATRQRLTPKSRREQNAALKDLVECVGESVRLYNIVLRALRVLFLANNQLPCYGTLRTDLLMLLHDEGVTAIYSRDPCHKFAWCLTACVKDGVVDHLRGREMKALLDATKGPALGDLGMIVLDSFAMNVLVASLLRQLATLVTERRLPRADEATVNLVYLLHLGAVALSVMSTANYTDNLVVPPQILGELLPLLVELMVDHALAQFGAHAPPSDVHFFARHPSVVLCVQQFAYCRKLLLAFVLDCCQHRQFALVLPLLRICASAEMLQLMVAEEPFVEQLCAALLELAVGFDTPTHRRDFVLFLTDMVRDVLALLAVLSPAVHALALNLLLDLRGSLADQVLVPLVEAVLGCVVAALDAATLQPLPAIVREAHVRVRTAWPVYASSAAGIHRLLGSLEPVIVMNATEAPRQNTNYTVGAVQGVIGAEPEFEGSPRQLSQWHGGNGDQDGGFQGFDLEFPDDLPAGDGPDVPNFARDENSEVESFDGHQNNGDSDDNTSVSNAMDESSDLSSGEE